MKLIGVIEMFNRGIGIIISRIVPVALVRLIHIFIAMAVGAWGSRGLMEALRAASPEGMPVGPHNIQEVLASLPQEQVFDAVLSPALWIAVVVNIIVFLWAQAALYLALYPNAKNPASGEPRSLAGVLVGAVGLMFPLIVVNVCYGALTLLGSLLLVIPGIWLSVKYSFSPILLVVEDQTAFGALGRSSDLVKDFWFGVFGRLFLLIIIVYLGGFLLSRIPFIGPVISGLVFPPLLAACQLAMVESLREIKTAPAPEAPAAQTPAV